MDDNTPTHTTQQTDRHAAQQAAPEVLYLPVAWILEHYCSTEGATWESTRAEFDRSHMHMDDLLSDIATHGVRTPVELNPDRKSVHRGHHRLLLAHDAGRTHVPVVFAWMSETTWWDPKTRRDVACTADDFDDWDDDEPPLPPWFDTYYFVPDDARAVALEPVAA